MEIFRFHMKMKASKLSIVVYFFKGTEATTRGEVAVGKHLQTDLSGIRSPLPMDIDPQLVSFYNTESMFVFFSGISPLVGGFYRPDHDPPYIDENISCLRNVIFR